MSRHAVGEIRSSQLLHSFGIGAVIDLPHVAALVMGLDEWDDRQSRTVAEERLLAIVRRTCGPQVERLVAPPMAPEERGRRWLEPMDQDLVGVPVASFPRWLRCPACNLLAPIEDRLFELKADRYRPERTRYVHGNCSRATRTPPALPARFVVACESGHLDDFPWVAYAHKGAACASPQLELLEQGVGGEVADIWVRCRSCSAPAQTLALAFGEDNRRRNMPQCRARHPHLRAFADGGCERRMKAILLGATNSWFAASVSLLAVPEQIAGSDALASAIEREWAQLSDVEEASTLRFLRRQAMLGTVARWNDEEIWAGIQARRAGATRPDVQDVKLPEWRLFSEPASAPRTPDFMLNEVAAAEGHRAWLKRVVRVDRLREVSALVGFTRIFSPRDFGEVEDIPEGQRVALSRGTARFIPATEVHGEGIFLEVKESRITEWVPRARAREDAFRRAHREWRRRLGIPNPDDQFPGIRFMFLHSLSHALMRQLVLECGYSASSLRERIYSREADAPGGAMAGILISTAAPDSEGTLGGLVSLAIPELLGGHIDRALDEVRLCAADPLCAEHDPSEGQESLHGAACHACLFSPETSCERGNRYLDRSLLVATMARHPWGFFEP